MTSEEGLGWLGKGHRVRELHRTELINLNSLGQVRRSFLAASTVTSVGLVLYLKKINNRQMDGNMHSLWWDQVMSQEYLSNHMRMLNSVQEK